jgi:hypothetical protein
VADSVAVFGCCTDRRCAGWRAWTLLHRGQRPNTGRTAKQVACDRKRVQIFANDGWKISTWPAQLPYPVATRRAMNCSVGKTRQDAGDIGQE